jgi:hypothetical protein
MAERVRAIVVLLCVGLLGAACDSVTGLDALGSFSWGELDEGTVAEEGIDVTGVLGEIFVLGELTTPTRCYRLTAEADRDGDRVTLRVDANSTGTDNCNTVQGNYRYTAVIRNLPPATYQVRAVHAVSGGETLEFSDTISVR